MPEGASNSKAGKLIAREQNMTVDTERRHPSTRKYRIAWDELYSTHPLADPLLVPPPLNPL